MQEYDRDGYEDYDDYEDEGQEQEYDYEEEEEGEEYKEEQPPKPTKEELDYLELRQKLKESIRKQMKKESSTSHAGSSERKKKLPYDNYGSFFGPSQPVIAQRVIQESKSLLENQHLASRLSNPLHINKNKNKVSNGGSKCAVHNPLPKVSEVKLKAQKIKNTRDYSFLLSDDAEIPAPTKEPPPRNMSARSSEARPAQVQGKSKQSLSSGSKHVYGGREDRKLGSLGGQLPPKGGSNNKVASTSKPSMASADSRRQLGNNSVNGPGRPVGPKGLPPKSLAPGIKGPVNAAQKPPISKAHSYNSKQNVEQRKGIRDSKQSVEQRKDTREKPRMMPKQPVSSSILQKSKPPSQVPTQRAIQDQRPKKKPIRRPFEDDDDEDQRAFSMIRRMFKMESIETKSISDMGENILRIFKDFMTGITKIDELGIAGSRLLTGLQQALDYIRRPPIDGTSELIDEIIKANGTQRVKMYIEAGCRNPLHGVQNVNKLNSCKLGLLDHISKAKVIVEELEGLLGDVTNFIQRTHGNLFPISEKDSDDELNDHAIHNDTESNSQNVDVTQLAALMSIIYSMVKQDYLMQEKIVSALNLKSSSGELESYCLLWSLRPFINDEIMHRAWRFIS